ncbi:MAG TPA: alpha/beta hydrolase [Pedobacter sp.]|nr:alpha/beta hydrolase [Pedobacter sp.]
MIRIYFISGLGADRRAFIKLKFPSEFELIHLDWIAPLKAEPLEAYASRMALNIDDTTPFYLVGLSFGGMLATEIAKKMKPVHTFLISSTPAFKQLPWYYRMAGAVSLQKMIPRSLLKTGNAIGLKFLGAKTHDEKELLKKLVADSDPFFIKWALTCILNWRNAERPGNTTHIHGTADKILPLKYNKPDIIIKGGSHFMVYTNAEEISGHIITTIKTIMADVPA